MSYPYTPKGYATVRYPDNNYESQVRHSKLTSLLKEASNVDLKCAKLQFPNHAYAHQNQASLLKPMPFLAFCRSTRTGLAVPMSSIVELIPVQLRVDTDTLKSAANGNQCQAA